MAFFFCTKQVYRLFRGCSFTGLLKHKKSLPYSFLVFWVYCGGFCFVLFCCGFWCVLGVWGFFVGGGWGVGWVGFLTFLAGVG